ncbi:hypothetical protein MW887_002534 [Aspergillus wentii]|nr:hypothetical protein MW887_002534 [Aspergillus wentii]
MVGVAISEATASCLQRFTECLEVEALMKDEWAENRLADFNLWVSGVGASARERASLDARLTGRSEAREVIVNLLCLIANVVDESLSGNSDSNTEFESDAGADGFLAPDEPPARPFSPWSDDSSSDSQSEETGPISTRNPLHDAMHNIEMMLDQLARIAVAVRRSGRRSRLQKADQRFNPQDHRELEEHLTTILLARPEFAKEQIDPSRLNEAQRRLIRCNLKRRNRFLYAQQHSKGLDPATTEHQYRTPVPEITKPPPDDGGNQKSRPIISKLWNGTMDTRTGTSASAMSNSFALKEALVPAPASSTVMSSTVIDLQYPRPPKINKDAQIFRCPCCCATYPVAQAEKNRWKKHVADDLSPYTCILPGCNEPDVLFTTKETWRRHILTEHRSFDFWVCFACSDNVQFYSEHDFIVHTTTAHASSIPQDQISLLTTVCKRSAPTEINSCPLCDWPEGQESEVDKDMLLDHIAREIHSFSLRALPWADDNGQETDERIDYSASKVYDWLIENSLADSPDQERPSCEKRHFTSEYFQYNAYFAGSSEGSSSSDFESDASWEVELNKLKQSERSVSFGSKGSDERSEETGEIRRIGQRTPEFDEWAFPGGLEKDTELLYKDQDTASARPPSNVPSHHQISSESSSIDPVDTATDIPTTTGESSVILGQAAAEGKLVQEELSGVTNTEAHDSQETAEADLPMTAAQKKKAKKEKKRKLATLDAFLASDVENPDIPPHSGLSSNSALPPNDRNDHDWERMTADDGDSVSSGADFDSPIVGLVSPGSPTDPANTMPISSFDEASKTASYIATFFVKFRENLPEHAAEITRLILDVDFIHAALDSLERLNVSGDYKDQLDAVENDRELVCESLYYTFQDILDLSPHRRAEANWKQAWIDIQRFFRDELSLPARFVFYSDILKDVTAMMQQDVPTVGRNEINALLLKQKYRRAVTTQAKSSPTIASAGAESPNNQRLRVENSREPMPPFKLPLPTPVRRGKRNAAHSIASARPNIVPTSIAGDQVQRTFSDDATAMNTGQTLQIDDPEPVTILISQLYQAAAEGRVEDVEKLLAERLSQDAITNRDEDFFDAECQKLYEKIEQWALFFSRHSDNRQCLLLGDLGEEKVTHRFDNAILDGSAADTWLGFNNHRTKVFTSVIMSMAWEFIFTRYLFGMDRDQRTRLKTAEKHLGTIAPPKTTHHWRAVILALSSHTSSFTHQVQSDTEAVAHEIFRTLCPILPPPTEVELQLLESLCEVIQAAAKLAIEMRTQLAEYIVLPPLQPKFDDKGNLVSQIFFNATLMNESSGGSKSNEDLEAQRAVVQLVLFPLVVKKGNDLGEGDDEIILYPAQVLVKGSTEENKREDPLAPPENDWEDPPSPLRENE